MYALSANYGRTHPKYQCSVSLDGQFMVVYIYDMFLGGLYGRNGRCSAIGRSLRNVKRPVSLKQGVKTNGSDRL